MCCIASPFNDSVEAINIVGGVSNLAHMTIGLNQAVGTMDDAILQCFRCVLVITGCRISYTV